jgi:hypothetical protein
VASDEAGAKRADQRGYEGMERIDDWSSRHSLYDAPWCGESIAFAEFRTVVVNGGQDGGNVVRVDLRVGFGGHYSFSFPEGVELSQEVLFIDVLRCVLPEPLTKACSGFELTIETRATRSEPVLVFRSYDCAFEVHALEMYRRRDWNERNTFRDWPKPIQD